MSPLSSIIEVAIQRATDAGAWSVSADDLERLYDPVSLFRVVYELRMVDTTRFDARNCGELVTLLERLGEIDAESRLRTAGLFLSHDDSIELMRRLVRGIKVGSAVVSANPDAFRAMLRDGHSYQRATDTYLSTFIDIEQIIERIADEFASDMNRPAIVIPGAVGQMERLIGRKIVIVEQLTPALFALLRTIAQQEGFLPRGSRGRVGENGQATDDFGAGHAPGEDRLSLGDRQAAIALFSTNGRIPVRDELHQRYRDLMRQFHPDINPKGLEMAKRINRAYSILLIDDE